MKERVRAARGLSTASAMAPRLHWLLCCLCLALASSAGAQEADNACAAADAQHIPVIDVSDLESPAVLDQLALACKRWGFFQAVNHSLDTSRLQALAHDFFALPLDVKLAVKRRRDNARGYANDELTKQKVDWKEIFDFGGPCVPRADANACADGVSQWPAQLGDAFERDLMRYFNEAARLSHRLLRALAASVGLNATAAAECFAQHTSFQRLNYYPVLPQAPEGTLGISRHTDAGALTLLWQEPGVSSLQVYSGYKEDRGDGAWVTVHPLDGALTVNIGDMFHVMTGGVCAAPEHRVLTNPTRARLSSPFFFNPGFDCNVSVMLAQAPQRFRPINWGVFRSKRFEGDYADVGEETQIEHFEITS